MKVVYPYDTTPFVKVAIEEVVKTLFEAILLVFLVMYLFLGNIRATLIPTLAVPVVILGTFAVLGLLGFSINMLTMFAMVLAIGLLVDDAIVVVENVERIMSEEGLPPMEATRKSMDQITSALIGIGLVLSAVFGPMAFFAGSTGVIYRQFSVTIIAAMLLSVLVALILTPVLCASLLKPVAKGHEARRAASFSCGRSSDGSTGCSFGPGTGIWQWSAVFSARSSVTCVIYLLIVAAMGFLFQRMPTAYLPDEDQGIMFVQVMLPADSTLEQTEQVMDEVKSYFLEEEKEAVESCMTVAGRDFSGTGQNVGMAFVKLKDWDLRNRPDLKVNAVVGRAMRGVLQDPQRNGVCLSRRRPSLSLAWPRGSTFSCWTGADWATKRLMAARNQTARHGGAGPEADRVRPNGLEDVPEYRIDVDWEKAGALGVPISSIHDTISAAFGSAYVNDFIQGGRVKRVYVQADAPYRMLPSDLERLYVRNDAGKMVPFSSFASGHWTSGSPRLERFNGFPSLNILGEAAPGRSSGEAMQAMEEIRQEAAQGHRL